MELQHRRDSAAVSAATAECDEKNDKKKKRRSDSTTSASTSTSSSDCCSLRSACGPRPLEAAVAVAVVLAVWALLLVGINGHKRVSMKEKKVREVLE